MTRPISYARQKTSRRVYVMLAAPWIISLAISSPIALGLNQTPRRGDTPRLCTFYNSDFLIYSSMGSFYVPTIVMMVLYWRVYVVIRSRRSASTSSSRNQQTRPANEPISCTATAPPPAIEARRGDGARDVTNGGPASKSDATLSAVAATLNAVQLHGEELARVATATAVDKTATVEQRDGTAGKCLSTGDRMPLPPIAVVATDDLAIVSPLSTSDGSVGTVLPTTAQLTPMSLSLDACDMDSTALDNGCADTEPKMASSSLSTTESCASAVTQKPSESERDSSTRRPDTLSVPLATLKISALCSQRTLVEDGVEASTRFNSDEENGQTVMQVDTAAAAAPVAARANVRFVTFFNFASKQQQQSQQSTATSAADRRLKRSIRRERRATKTLAIVLGNLFIAFYELHSSIVP